MISPTKFIKTWLAHLKVMISNYPTAFEIVNQIARRVLRTSYTGVSCFIGQADEYR